MTITSGTPAQFCRTILEKGFYPENIPPVFVVSRFYDFCDHSGAFKANQTERDKPLTLARYNSPKRGGKRRVFSICNPIPYIDLCDFITNKRKDINNLLEVSDFSYSKPQFDITKNQRLFLTSYSEFARERKKLLAESKYIVKIDISRFYHSIYTHSIPWAMHGKSDSKKNRKPFSGTVFGNTIDYFIRQAQDQQTIGIPVGPDTSRIVSELISAAIDVEFLKKCGDKPPAARLVDDVFIGANSLEEGESYLQAYREAVHSFELDLSDQKTAIVPTRYDLEDFWSVQIRRELERYRGAATKSGRADLVVFLDEILRTANTQDDDGVIRYAIRKLDDFNLWIDYWQELEPFLARCILNFPHSADYVARVVSWRHRIVGVATDKWGRIIETFLGYHSRLGADGEVCWGAWLAKEIGSKVSADIAEEILARCGPLSALLILDLSNSGQIRGRFGKTHVYQRLDDNPILSSDWLLSYEAERIFGYRVKGKNRTDYSIIGDMIASDVAFYDDDALPVVFEEAGGEQPVDALEKRIGSYEEDEDECDDDEVDFPF